MTAQTYLLSRESSILLSDQRKLSWFEEGPEQGRPVLFCTGAGMSGQLGFGLNHLLELNLRLISVDRPGLGRSDKDAEKSLVTWVQDISQLIAALQLSRPLAVGFSQGAPFAYALAAAGLVEKLAIVSGQDEFARSEVKSKLPSEVSSFVSSIQTRNPTFIKTFSESADAEGLFKLVLGTSSEIDKSFYGSEPFKTHYRRALQEGFQQGSTGYVQDLVSTFSDWPFQIEDIRIPVEVWHGAHDASSVHSPDFGDSISRRLKNCHRHFLQDEGGALLWMKSFEILDGLSQ